VVKLERPLLDIGFSGQSLPTEVSTLPEILSNNQGNMLKADVWLLGIITVQLLTGQLFKRSAIDVTLEGGQDQESLWRLFMSQDKADNLHPMAISFLSSCFKM
jgi:hypothetical protein